MYSKILKFLKKEFLKKPDHEYENENGSESEEDETKHKTSIRSGFLNKNNQNEDSD